MLGLLLGITATFVAVGAPVALAVWRWPSGPWKATAQPLPAEAIAGLVAGISSVPVLTGRAREFMVHNAPETDW